MYVSGSVGDFGLVCRRLCVIQEILLTQKIMFTFTPIPSRECFKYS